MNLPREATTQVVETSVAEAYAAWSSGTHESVRRDPYYSERVVRFGLRDGDVLRSPGDVTVRRADCGVRLGSERANASLSVCGVGEREADAFFDAIDGQRTLVEAREAAHLEPEAWTRLVEGTFGVLIFAPRAVEELESRISGAEVVRYAGSPYEIVREYWENMGAVAARLTVPGDERSDSGAFIRWLRELNTLALVGPGRATFYLPASPIVGKFRVLPGELYASPPVVEKGGADGAARFVSGPRVNASFIGGDLYHALLSAALRDPLAALPEREFRDTDGVFWGSIVLGRAASDDRAAPWFCPPRPFDLRHFDALRAALSTALAASTAGDSALVLRALAEFHQRFVRLHPFRAGNQCVAMSIVNHVLRRALRAGIPHLVLDHLALRLSADAYARVFSIAVSAWLVADRTPVSRYVELIARRDRCFAFLNELGAAASVADAERLVRERPDDARLALIEPSFVGFPDRRRASA